MMNMQARNQYLYALISKKGGYHLQSKKTKTQILNEYCRITGQNRIAVSRKIRTGKYIQTIMKETQKKKQTRSLKYNHEITAYLITLWEIFDSPCGQRLKPLIYSELNRLRKFREIIVSDDVALLLKTISPRTIDEKLRIHKEKERLQRKYMLKPHPLLYQKIPVKLSINQGRSIGENIQIDLVEHCGQSAQGSFLRTLSITDVGSGWWEAEDFFGKSAWNITKGLGRIQYRFPFPWKEIHSDNGSEFINEIVWGYTVKNKLRFSRSRPYAKNDNCFVEQKNGTHIRKIVGYQRYDTKKERDILNELYRNELRLYKNFFQPIIPLIFKERIGGKIRRKYGEPKTPYQRIMESQMIPNETKKELQKLYETLNPAELKRKIKMHQDRLYQAYCKKTKKEGNQGRIYKKLKPHSETFLIAEPMVFQKQKLIA